MTLRTPMLPKELEPMSCDRALNGSDEYDIPAQWYCEAVCKYNIDKKCWSPVPQTE